MPLPVALEIYEQLAGFDASVGWIVWNNALPCLFGRFLPAATRAEIFADPDWLHASSTRPSAANASAASIVPTPSRAIASSPAARPASMPASRIGPQATASPASPAARRAVINASTPALAAT